MTIDSLGGTVPRFSDGGVVLTSPSGLPSFPSFLAILEPLTEQREGELADSATLAATFEAPWSVPQHSSIWQPDESASENVRPSGPDETPKSHALPAEGNVLALDQKLGAGEPEVAEQEGGHHKVADVTQQGAPVEAPAPARPEELHTPVPHPSPSSEMNIPPQTVPVRMPQSTEPTIRKSLTAELPVEQEVVPVGLAGEVFAKVRTADTMESPPTAFRLEVTTSQPETAVRLINTDLRVPPVDVATAPIGDPPRKPEGTTESVDAVSTPPPNNKSQFGEVRDDVLSLPSPKENLQSGLTATATTSGIEEAKPTTLEETSPTGVVTVSSHNATQPTSETTSASPGISSAAGEMRMAYIEQLRFDSERKLAEAPLRSVRVSLEARTESVELSLTTKSQGIRVVAHTHEPLLNQALQRDLPELTNRLTQQGYDVRPAIPNTSKSPDQAISGLSPTVPFRYHGDAGGDTDEQKKNRSMAGDRPTGKRRGHS